MCISGFVSNMVLWPMNGQGPGERKALRPVRRGRPPGLPGGKRLPYQPSPGESVSLSPGRPGGLPLREAVGGYRCNQAWANTSPGTRAVQEACPYERNRAVWFLWGAAIMDNILLKLSKTDKHISISIHMELVKRLHVRREGSE